MVLPIDVSPLISASRFPARSDLSHTSLGNTENNLSTLSPDRIFGKSAYSEWRRELYRMQHVAKTHMGHNGPKGLPHCGCKAQWRRGQDGRMRKVSEVGIRQSASGRCRFDRTLRCGSVWSCPVCATWKGQWRTATLIELAQAHLSGGGSLYHITATVPHSRADDLKHQASGVSTAWSEVQGGGGWKTICRRFGVVGLVRALEVTHGARGWHCHLHIIAFTDGVLTAEDTKKLRGTIFQRWAQAAERQGLDRPLEYQPGTRKPLGVHLEHVSDAQAASYLAKSALSLGLAREPLRHPTRRSRAPFQVLRDLAYRPSARDGSLWAEWCAGMVGVRQITVAGKQLKGRYPELTSSLCRRTPPRSDRTPHDPLVSTIRRREFERLATVPGWRATVLNVAERHGKRGVDHFVQECLRRVVLGQDVSDLVGGSQQHLQVSLGAPLPALKRDDLSLPIMSPVMQPREADEEWCHFDAQAVSLPYHFWGVTMPSRLLSTISQQLVCSVSAVLVLLLYMLSEVILIVSQRD